MYVLGVDVGTTHCKAAVFGHNGEPVALAHHPTPQQHHRDGSITYDPDALWSAVASTIADVAARTPPNEIAAVAIASMAETGLLIDRETRTPRTPLLPWFDRRPTLHADQIAAHSDRFERFCATGQYPNYKSGVAKLLWLREQQPDSTADALWLGAADYIALRLTNEVATDHTLAARTYAFRIDQRAWDADWLAQWNFTPTLFPPAYPSGTPIGAITAACAATIGLARGTPVAIAGHDHVCAAWAVGAITPERVFDSMGTAETLIGSMPATRLTQKHYESGLTYGPHVIEGHCYWMGGLSASGGSIEWLRSVLGDPPLSYTDLLALVAAAGSDPTGILYFPYLLGSGTPHPDQHAKGSLLGLSADHTRAHVAKAFLEGTAYELEFIRRAAEHSSSTPIKTIVVAGGGTRIEPWLQIKADVGGCRMLVPAVTEATLLGAALLAGIGCGMYADVEAALSAIDPPTTTITPNSERHQIYKHLYEHGYEPLQHPLRHAWAQLASKGAPRP